MATLMSLMDSAHIIREAVAKVAALRTATASNMQLWEANLAVKRFQGRRFAGTYADLLQTAEYGGAARFFLHELYCDKDYTQRDAQFARIADALQKFFPSQVVDTAVALAELHSLTEDLDQNMAEVLLLRGNLQPTTTARGYMETWRSVGRFDDRARQIELVLRVGADLNRLTRKPGLRMMLRMMRKPADMAGLGALQSFLEAGFDTFAEMAGTRGRGQTFLGTISVRETQWMEKINTADDNVCVAALEACLKEAI